MYSPEYFKFAYYRLFQTIISYLMKILLQREKIFFMLAWSLLAYSLLKLTYTFSYSFDNNILYVLFCCCLQSLFYFLFTYLLRIRYVLILKYFQYLILSIVLSMLVFIFAFTYHIILSIGDESFNFSRYIFLGVFNLIFSSVVFINRTKTYEN